MTNEHFGVSIGTDWVLIEVEVLSICDYLMIFLSYVDGNWLWIEG